MDINTEEINITNVGNTTLFKRSMYAFFDFDAVFLDKVCAIIQML